MRSLPLPFVAVWSRLAPAFAVGTAAPTTSTGVVVRAVRVGPGTGADCGVVRPIGQGTAALLAAVIAVCTWHIVAWCCAPRFLPPCSVALVTPTVPQTRFIPVPAMEERPVDASVVPFSFSIVFADRTALGGE